MKKILFFVFCIIFISGCSIEGYVPPEREHLYWKDIDVVITKISKSHWYAGTHKYEVTIIVENEEYGLKDTIVERGQGMFGLPSSWNYEEGDTVKAELFSWVIDSTGEVTKRKINKLVYY